MVQEKSAHDLDSIITAVTVYIDRALVKRRAEIDLPGGEHTLHFIHLPHGLLQDSIQVNGRGEAVISDIRFREEHFTITPDQDMKDILNQKEQLEEQVQVLDDEKKRIEKESAFIEGFLNKMIQPAKKPAPEEQDPDSWMKVMSLYRERQTALDEESRANTRAKKELMLQINKIMADIKFFHSRQSRKRELVEVLVDMKKEGKLVLNLSYIIPGPSWTPVYDIRVSGADKVLSLGYQALVRQSTSEDWQDVELSLSTAQVHLHGREPELSPWYVDIYHPAPPRTRRLAMAATGGVAPDFKKKALKGDREDADMDDFIMPPAEAAASEPSPQVEAPAVALETRSTSVEFRIQARTSVNSDGNSHKVSIMNRDMPAEFQYSSTPRLSGHAYLQAKVKNETDFPLLAGSSHIFLDNAFVANSSLDTVAPQEEFITFLGVDEGIKVEHKLLKKFHKNEGLIGKKTRIIYEYQIHLHNLKQTPEKITVKDQVPLSRHQDIVVNLVKPVYKQDSESLKKKDFDFLEWNMELKPGEERDIPLHFSVEYPEKERVTGI